MTLLKKCIPLPLADRKNLLRLRPKPQSEFQISSESCAILRIASERQGHFYLRNVVVTIWATWYYIEKTEPEMISKRYRGGVTYDR